MSLKKCRRVKSGAHCKDSLTALKRHYEQLVASPDAVVVGYRFAIDFNDPSREFTKAHLAKVWFSQIMHRLGGVADNQTASGAFFREAIKNDGIRCFWGSSSHTDGSGVSNVYVVVKAVKFMENAMYRHLVRIFGWIYGVHVF